MTFLGSSSSLLLLAMFCVFTFSTGAEGGCDGGTISISATGSVKAPHDEATVSFTLKGFHTSSVDKARRDCAEATHRTMGIVHALGIPDRNVTTESINVTPEYVWEHRNHQERTLKGYSVTNSLSLRLQQFDKLSEVIDKV